MNQFTGLLGLQGSPWQGALAGVGQGLLAAGSGGNFGQGLTGGIQDWRQQQMQRQQMQREQELFEFQRRKYEADQAAAAQAQQQQAAQAEAVKKWATTDPRVAPYADVLTANPSAAYDVLAKYVEPAGAPKTVGGLQWDGDSWEPIPGYTAQAAAIAAAGRNPNPNAGPTERQKNAIAAGLQPGTPEYQQYILGRDDTAPGPFQGTGLDAQSFNIVLTGDPSAPEYAAAYMQLAQPKTQLMPDGTAQTVSPDMSWARKPAGAMPSPQQTPGAQTSQLPGATVTTLPGSGITPQDRQKLRGVKAEATAIKEALTRFKDVVKETGAADRASAATGGLTEGGRRLNSAWTNAAIMTKAEALFNLGVLNGPDLSVIQGTLPNPSTLTGAIASDEAYNTAIDEVLSLIDNKVAAFEAQFGGTPYTRPGATTTDDGWTTLPSGIRIRRKS